ncbi:lycopene beta-cyclase CrtY [Sphingomonas lenta]|uniref:Lycopene cyclase n=1 Tax=Sphingomonas lenta TaxID=1141887 RepID=A0A2A2SC57_9SPHN|nr:lycopene beta-cyclase CrtY [Sphingomonas lenta]PAX06847.1 lycopene cyclase [Sphingomonas lenta]
MAHPSNHGACDVAIVGAGLAGGLLALALAKKHPELDVRLIDAGDSVGGNHLWSFFGTDVADADRWLLAPLVVHAWRDYDVRFPAHARTIPATYYSIESARLDEVVRRTLPPERVMLGRKVASISPTAVAMQDGERLEATGVIDARGAADLSTLELGWQKFLGRELELDEPHDVERPVVMDATVRQVDGYRFMYVMPFAERRVFLEDTYYSDSPTLNARAVSHRLDRYAADKGWAGRTVREEQGVLPVAIGGDFDSYWRSGGARVAKAGMRAGLFHPTTGYSLPDAVRLAVTLAKRRDFAGADLHQATYDYARACWQARRFYRMLDAMLFRAAEPQARYRVLQRFYRLDRKLIGRFYAGRSTMKDKARILMGRPPVPVGRALSAIRGVR